ncbi:4Fe-4S ferredoxin [Oryzomonas sagensis]|uniref:4Fe-4S ferredoxin n=1 Tax=Oryzomonas sagensis TaxID=2603857 RepID=A0ABQ6TRT6_9BACT|nr:4Fe-4S binding protein [Oryzomonas sagensis]KAB0671723.1 4Fe-4S ferredoxin [Oryzomonas sagensis]
MLRKIVKIDQDKCDGCGLCVPSCAEGAIKIVGGKAVLSAENLCDGLGACLGECPRGAITVEEREADEFDEAAVERHLVAEGKPVPGHHHAAPAPAQHHHHGGGCPGSRAMSFARPQAAAASEPTGSRQSQLAQWPVQLHLVSTSAPYFQGADLLITADCVPVAYAGYHEDFLKGRAVVMGCPKLDDNQFYQQKLTELFIRSDIKSVTVLKMEVPCCGGIAAAARQAVAASGKQIPYNEVTIGIQGQIKK